jgi:hypothetical protein
VKGFRAAGPILIRSVAAAISSRGAIAGGKSRSWKTETASNPASSARRASGT